MKYASILILCFLGLMICHKKPINLPKIILKPYDTIIEHRTHKMESSKPSVYALNVLDTLNLNAPKNIKMKTFMKGLSIIKNLNKIV